MIRKAKPWFYRQTGWWMAYIDGKKQRLAFGRENRKAAETKLLELRLVAATNVGIDAAEQTVASVIEQYLSVAVDELAESTQEIRLPYLQSFAEMHGWRKVSDCRPSHMRQWMKAHPEWVSDWTKNGAIRNVQVAFNWAAGEERLIKENPFRGVTHHAGQPRRPLTEDEFRALMRASNGRRSKQRPSSGARFREFLIFLRFTGCRPCEAARLHWNEVQGNCIVLLEHKTSRTQRVRKPRVIPLHPVVVKLLIGIRRRNEGERVFLSHTKTPWTKNSLALRVRRARKKAGLPDDAKLYGTRHAFGTRAIVNGVALKTLAELLGHTTTRMSEHYLHLAGEHAHLASAMQIANARH
jgi:integrase